MGSTQIVHILVTLLKGKIVALLVGVAGTGLSSIYWNATSWIQQLASLGLPLAAVKDIAKETDSERRSRLISLVKSFFFIAANAGAILCLLASPLLSAISFADYSHTPEFMVLSIFVWFAVMGAGELTVFQGLNQVKPLYKATIVGSVTGVLSGLPFYWFLGLKGIVWALSIASVATYLALHYRLRRIVDVRRAPARLLWSSRKLLAGTLKAGLVLFLGGIVGAVVNFTLISVIRAGGGVDDVGCYQSALNIISQIGAIVFAAMAVDYFPKIAASQDSSMRTLVENQIQLGVGLTVPIMCILMLGAPVAVRLLLSEEFLVILPVLKWFAFAMVLKAVSYPLGYIALAKAKPKVYLKVEVFGLNLLYLAGMLAGFYFRGLVGLGIGLAVIYALDIVVYLVLCRRLFSLTFGRLTLCFSLAGVLYAALMLHLSISDDQFLHPLIPGLVAVGSLAFPLVIFKTVKKHLAPKRKMPV